ncbi:MAG: FAD-dependent oxidoreductase [Spirochaetales bacterium]|nr:FAD-dependent oxidoreductase [Spirochaetales bacterium]
MNNQLSWDILVIGSGPAGLAAAVAARDSGANVALVEREERPGGILKQCIHDGFGLIRFGEQLTGPAYAARYVDMVVDRKVPMYLSTFLEEIKKEGEGFSLTLRNSEEGIFRCTCGAVVFATGCRERSDRQVFIHGTRPAGIFTAGLAQYFINIQGQMPTRKCVILGSGDIGLIMARRLTLEGAEVEGVYEIKPEPSGLYRNISQCLDDYSIPLHLSSTVTEVHGRNRVEGVTVCQVDEKLKPVPGTERRISCDSLILSVGLIPENEFLKDLEVDFDSVTGGPVVDQTMMASVPGLFSCGNSLMVNDLVDYVSVIGEQAGKSAAEFVKQQEEEREKGVVKRTHPLIPVRSDGSFLVLVPQKVDADADRQVTFYFRSSRVRNKTRLKVSTGEGILKEKFFLALRPPEMENVQLEIPGGDHDFLTFTLEEVE